MTIADAQQGVMKELSLSSGTNITNINTIMIDDKV